MEEVSRVANSAEFNGGRILDGTVEDLFFQVGANQGQTIAVSGVDSRTTQLGISEVVGAQGPSQEQIAEELTGFDGNLDIETAEFAISDFAGSSELIDGDDGIDISGADTLDDVVRIMNTAINDAVTSGENGAEAVSDAALEVSVRVNNQGESTIAVTGALDADFSVSGDGTALDGDGDAMAPFLDGSLLIASRNVDLTQIDVMTRETATQAMGALDGALTEINSLRAELGAVQTRFESTISNLEIGSENLSDARSRIRDADFAAETADLTRAQVLQQAGTSVLSQANAVPQNVLGLLQ
uniref:flagellin n=1 Tax=Thioalkalivibrio sp. ALE11 TaxID=1265494 RepID=UPI000370ED11|nr:flagellin [Thioalkalivibrio sp. ALE11]